MKIHGEKSGREWCLQLDSLFFFFFFFFLARNSPLLSPARSLVVEMSRYESEFSSNNEFRFGLSQNGKGRAPFCCCLALWGCCWAAPLGDSWVCQATGRVAEPVVSTLPTMPGIKGKCLACACVRISFFGGEWKSAWRQSCTRKKKKKKRFVFAPTLCRSSALLA